MLFKTGGRRPFGAHSRNDGGETAERERERATRRAERVARTGGRYVLLFSSLAKQSVATLLDSLRSTTHREPIFTGLAPTPRMEGLGKLKTEGLPPPPLKPGVVSTASDASLLRSIRVTSLSLSLSLHPTPSPDSVSLFLASSMPLVLALRSINTT